MLVHLGVDEESKAWRVLDPDSKDVKISRNLHFCCDERNVKELLAQRFVRAFTKP